MIDRVGETSPARAGSDLLPAPVKTSREDVGLRFEQLFWAEMLSQAGFAKALTKGGGEGVASFSRFLVESIAADLAERHPLGFADKVNLPVGGTQ